MHHLPDTAASPLDATTCRQARLSRDRRFDGEFYFAVTTTGIYCRPICPARTPAEKNVRYFRLASQAAGAGFRPCLRCRPESAPASPAWRGTSTTVQRALQLIGDGALNGTTLGAFAGRLGIGERYLRKLFARELGVSPLAVAQHQRLLFARKLIHESTLPMTQIALAAGFGSVRRFNSAMREHFRQTPGELRRQIGRDSAPDSITMTLQYRPPYDWDSVRDFFSRHAIDGVETVTDSSITRHLQYREAHLCLHIEHAPRQNALRLRIDGASPAALMPVVARVRRVFDLDANPQTIGASLARDPRLRPLVSARPGVRSPTFWSPFEAAVRAVAGQQVSTAAARNVLAKLVHAAAQTRPGPFPTPATIGSLADDAFAMPARRRETLRALCDLTIADEDALDLERLAALRGVGPWTVALVAMRGEGQTDLFPRSDLGLEKAWSNLTDDSAADLYEHVLQWRPWGAYAANLLWQSLS